MATRVNDKGQDDLLLAALAGLVPAVEPPSGARARLRGQLLARVAGPRMHVVRAGEGEWRPLLPGIEVKTLRRDPAQRTETTLWRLAPGAQVPPHPHRHEEECLILEGSVLQEGVEYLARDYLLADPGHDHPLFSAPSGALLLIRSELLESYARPPRPARR